MGEVVCTQCKIEGWCEARIADQATLNAQHHECKECGKLYPLDQMKKDGNGYVLRCLSCCSEEAKDIVALEHYQHVKAENQSIFAKWIGACLIPAFLALIGGRSPGDSTMIFVLCVLIVCLVRFLGYMMSGLSAPFAQKGSAPPVDELYERGKAVSDRIDDEGWQ